MAYTEEEAREKWCPFALHNTTAGNRRLGQDGASQAPHDFPCIASKCMAWRWERVGAQRGYCGRAGSDT